MATSNGVIARRAGARHAREAIWRASPVVAKIAVAGRACSTFRATIPSSSASGLADKLRLAPGMTITLIAPRGNVTPFGVTPRIKTYTIAGTFKIGMIDLRHELRLHAARRGAALFQHGQ